jgi:hypothetical protein
MGITQIIKKLVKKSFRLCALSFIGLLPYVLGLLVARPVTLEPAIYGYTERSLSFFAFVFFLHAFVICMGRIQLKRAKSSRPIKIHHYAALVVSVIGLLASLTKAKSTLINITGSFSLLLLLLALLPIKKRLLQKKAWKSYFYATIAVTLCAALASFTVHYAESPLFVLAVALLSLNSSIVLDALTQAAGPLLLIITAAALGTIAHLLPLISTEQEKSQAPIWYSDVTIVLLMIPPTVLGLLAVVGVIPQIFRFAYAGILPVVLLQQKYRKGRLPLPGFTSATTNFTLIIILLFLTLGAFS